MVIYINDAVERNLFADAMRRKTANSQLTKR